MNSKIRLFIGICTWLTGCSVTNKLEPQQELLLRNTLVVDGIKTNNDSIKSIIRQKPNKRFLGIPLALMIHQSARSDADTAFVSWLHRKPKRLEKMRKLWSKKQIYQMRDYIMGFQKWKKSVGEAPSLVDSFQMELTSQKLNSYLKNKGYFKSKVNFEKKSLDKKGYAEVIYSTTLGLPYYLDTISVNIASPAIDSLYFASKNNAVLKRGNQFNTLDFEKERNRLYNNFRNAGVFDFQLNSINFEVAWDTTGLDYVLPVKLEISDFRENSEDGIIYKPYTTYKFKKINVFIDTEKENYTNHTEYDGIHFYSKGKLKYRPKVIANAIVQRPNDLFRDQDRSATLRQFTRLQSFDYPRLNVDYSSDETNSLDAHIFLTPKERFSLGFGLDLTQSNILDSGVAFNSSLGILNVFRGAEILEIGTRGSIGRSADLIISEIGMDVGIRFPRIFFPIKTEKIIPNKMDPSTSFNLGTSLQNNIGLDKQNFTINLEYLWKPTPLKKYGFKLIDFELVNNRNITNYFNVYQNTFEDLNTIASKINTRPEYFENGRLIIPEGANSFINYILSGGSSLNPEDSDFVTVQRIQERKRRLTQNNLIIGSSFSYSRNTRTSFFDDSFSQFRFKIEAVGNLIEFFSNPLTLKLKDGKKILFELPYSQYLKSEIDYIKHWSILGGVLASRTFMGVALPVGNSNSIPFNRSYFSGGANDNRAWEVYRLGPGSSNSSNEFNEANLKLAFSLEYRFGLIGPLKGALFVDAGNIWNIADDVNDPDQRFDHLSDLEELAVGMGFGLRYDFGLFIFRFDTGFKAHNPALPKSNRWWTDFNFNEANFTIGINYPF